METSKRRQPARSAGMHRDTPARRPPSPAADGSITHRELDILILVSQGLSYRLIARTLAITPRTASFHMVAVRGKLGATNNAHAVALACRDGLLPTNQKKSPATCNK